MRKNIIAGIDIGTYHVRVLVAEQSKGGAFEIIGTGQAESKGLRHGYIINHADAANSIQRAISHAEKMCGVKIRQVMLGIGGIGLSSFATEASVSVSRGDNEITELDIKNITEECQRKIPPHIASNHKIVHTIPIYYKIDGQLIYGDPISLKGVRIEAKILFITCLTKHSNDLVRAVNDAGADVINLVANPIAASLVSLTKAQKIAGCVLANIGSETVSIIIYENGIPISLEVFPIGSNDITNDIALGLKIPLEEAEHVKISEKHASIPKRRLDEIIMARLSDIFELIEAHLKKIGKSGLLPAGIILTGGGSGITTIEDLARAYLNLPSKVLKQEKKSSSGKVEIKNSMWAVSYGLCVLGLSDSEDVLDGFGNQTSHSQGSFLQTLTSWFKQFLP